MDCATEPLALIAAAPAPKIGRRGLFAQARRAVRIRLYIHEHCTDPTLSAKECARELGMSLRSLYLALESQGVSFSSLLAQARLNRCRELLQRPDAPNNAADLAFACGFNSLSSFYRAFRRHRDEAAANPLHEAA